MTPLLQKEGKVLIYNNIDFSSSGGGVSLPY
jgi:hypothetical protein